MKIACVFGGSGFLGSHVADKLSVAGYKVRIFDRIHSPWLSSNQEMIVGDITDSIAVRSAISGADVVYNFAALSDLNDGINKPIETIEVNVLGNANVLEGCRVCNVNRFVYASTVYVLGKYGGFYRCSKQASEHYIMEYQRIYGLNYTILRYGSLYGPRSDLKNGLYRIVRNALDTGIVSYTGNPESSREYIHVEDAATASVDTLGDEFINQSIVLTGQEPMRIVDMLKMLAEILGYDFEIARSETEYNGHYIRTPYGYESKIGKKYIPPLHVDLGQGLVQLIDEIYNYEANKSNKSN